MSKKIVLLGGGGHCKSVLDTLLSSMEYSEIGIVDRKENVGKKVLSVPIIGCDDDLFRLYEDGFEYAFVTIGSVGNPLIRIKRFTILQNMGFEIPNIIDKKAMIGNHVKLENGIFIGKNVVVNTGSLINRGAIINTSSTVEHDCKIEEFAHIAPGSVLCGEVHIKKNTHIGANSVIKQQLIIGSNSVIGMGSVVLTNINDNVIAYGNPCREVQSN